MPFFPKKLCATHLLALTVSTVSMLCFTLKVAAISCESFIPTMSECFFTGCFQYLAVTARKLGSFKTALQHLFQKNNVAQ